jgi:rubrerythrin
LALSCKDQGKQLSTQYYARPNISAIEVRSPETVIKENIGNLDAVIEYPINKSPAMQRENEVGTSNVLQDLITAEKVARRQYDELIMFPELSKFVTDLLYIRNDEHEHEKILECIIQRLGNSPTAQPITQPKQASRVTLTPQALGEFYETILDRFGDEEEKSVNSYQELLAQVQDSKVALSNARYQGKTPMKNYSEAMVPLNELERKINKHLNEERVHLDVIDAMQEMFSNMKLGKVY